MILWNQRLLKITITFEPGRTFPSAGSSFREITSTAHYSDPCANLFRMLAKAV